MSFTLLITCIGDELAPHALRAMREHSRHDIAVVGVDTREDVVGRHFVDHFATVPRGDDPDYAAAIRDIAQRHNVDVILPKSDEEALALAQVRDMIEADGSTLACADLAVLKIFADKAETHRSIAAMGLCVPDWHSVHTMDQLEVAVGQVVGTYGEAVVKPALMRGGRGVCVIRNDISETLQLHGGREVHMTVDTFRLDYMADFASLFPAIVMERLQEPVYDVDMLAWQGKPIRVVARRRVNSAAPNEGHTIVDNKDLIDLGNQLIRHFGLSWLYDCDVMYDRDGRPVVIEINPRPSGSYAVTMAAGIPLLDDLISLAKGEAVPDIIVKAGQVIVPFKSLAVVAE